MIVMDSKTGDPCILSNWHVLAASTAALMGDEIIQPGPGNLNPSDPPTKVGELLRWTNLDHGYDAAIARIIDGFTFSNHNQDANVQLVSAVEPTLGMRLVKSGLSSHFTHAIVDGVDGSYPIDYSNYGDTTRWMDGIHLVPDPSSKDEEISLDGDSGSVWFENDTGCVVALNFSGEDGLGPLAEYALAHRIPRVLELLDVRVP
jgi:endonuclease G